MSKKIAKVIAMILAVASLASLLGACGSSGNSAPAETKAPAAAVAETVAQAADGDLTGKKVGFSSIMMSSDFFANMSNEMDEYFTGVGMTYNVADANGDAQTQITNVENFVTMGMDYIILFPVDKDSICDALVKAREQGIFVIAIGTVLTNPDAYDVCINISQYSSGEVEAQMAAEWIEATFPDAADGSIEVAVMGCADNEDAIDRSNGLKTISEYTSKAVLVDYKETAQSEGAAGAQIAMDAIMANHPNIKCLLTYGTDQGEGCTERALANPAIDPAEFGIFTVDTNDYIFGEIRKSASNESVLRGTVKLGDGTPMTCYKLISGEWMDMVVDGVYKEQCHAVNVATIDEYDIH